MEYSIDVIIPAHEKDLITLDLCIENVKKYVKGVKEVYVISKDKLTDNATWYPEDKLPFSLSDVASKIGKHWRVGWYFADILEGYASVAVKGNSTHTLILDADTVFLRPVGLVENGKVCLNTSPTDGTIVYDEWVTKIIPGLEKQNKNSGVTHWVLQDNKIVKEMVSEIESIHGKPFWEACLDVTLQKYNCLTDNNHKTCPGKMACFELYFTYALQKHPDKVMVKNQHSILAYKETIGFSKKYQKTEISRTNTQGRVMVLSFDDEEKINSNNYDSIQDAVTFTTKVISEKNEWDVITYQCHFWENHEDYKKMNLDSLTKKI